MVVQEKYNADAMRQDAVRRIMDMHRRARKDLENPVIVEASSVETIFEEEKETAPLKRHKATPLKIAASKEKAAPLGMIDNLLSAFNMDKDRMLLLGILFLLIREKANFKLILAIGYILM